MCELSRFRHVWLWPHGLEPPGFSAHGVFPARILEWIALSYSRGILPIQGSNLGLSCLLHLVQSLSYVQLFDPVDCSMAGFPVHHQLPELAQIYVHRVSDVIQPSHPPRPLLFLPSVFPSIRVFSNESVLCIRWPKYWSFSLSISPSNEYSGLNSFRMDWFDLLAVQRTLKVFSNTTVQKHQFFGAQLSLWSNFHIHMWLLEEP